MRFVLTRKLGKKMTGAYAARHDAFHEIATGGYIFAALQAELPIGLGILPIHHTSSQFLLCLLFFFCHGTSRIVCAIYGKVVITHIVP